MISVLIMSIMFMAILSATGFAIISLTQSTSEFYGAQQDVDQIDKWQALVINSLMPYGENQQLLTPNGVQESDSIYMTVPKLPGSVGLSSVNSKGYPLIYCPLNFEGAYNSDSTFSIKIGDSENEDSIYDVNLVSVKNVDYVSATSNTFKFASFTDDGVTTQLEAKNILAIIMSPLDADYLSCDKIRSDYTAIGSNGFPNAIVRVIERNSVLEDSIDKPLYISVTEETSLDQVFSPYASVQPSRFIADIDNKTLPAINATIESEFPGTTSQVIVKGNGASISSGVITFKNVNANIKGVSLDPSVVLNLVNSKLIIDEATTLGVVNSSNSEIIVDAAATMGDLSLNGSNLYVGVPSEFGAIVAERSELSFVNGKSSIISSAKLTKRSSLLVSNSSSLSVNVQIPFDGESVGILVDETSELVLSESSNLISKSENISQNVIASLGSVVIDESSVYATNSYMSLIRAYSGSKLKLDNSNIGLKDTGGVTNGNKAIKLLGIITISGTGSGVNTNNGNDKCWDIISEGESNIIENAQHSNLIYESTEKITSPLTFVNQSEWTCVN